jgi:hypothetical protein
MASKSHPRYEASQRGDPMNFFACLCIATALLGECTQDSPGIPDRSKFCQKDGNEMLLDAAGLSFDRDLKPIRADAEALVDVLHHHSAGGGPSSPENVARYQRFREFVKKKCHRDIGRSLTEF